MVDPFKGVPYSFGALRKTFGRLYVRCDVCRRFALLQLGRNELRNVDSRTKRSAARYAARRPGSP
jgi:hypothetical protein